MKLICFFSLVAIFLSPTIYGQATPTWADNTACIFYTHCTDCHNPSGIAPFSLINYSDAYSFRSFIKNDVTQGLMPPWPPDTGYTRFAHERILSQEEIDLIRDWVDGGALQGNPSNAPVPPTYDTTGSKIAADFSARIPVYTKDTIPDKYRNFVLQTSYGVDKYISEIEVVPGNRSLVHHVLIFYDTTNQAIILDNADTLPGYDNFGGSGVESAELIGGWVPGAALYKLPQGMGIRLPANATLILQIHYAASALGEKDSTQLNLKFTPSVAVNFREVSTKRILTHGTHLIDGPLLIPANEVKTFHARSAPVPVTMSALAVAPHMHLVGTSIKSYAITASNDTIKFIDIPKWDFHWQGQYFFQKPLIIPAGSRLYAEAVYDNTVNNPSNPNTPPELVRAGESSTEEMMIIYFSFLPYKAGDENIIIDTTSVIQTYNNCNYSLGMKTIDSSVQQFEIYPNPSVSDIYISFYSSKEEFGDVEIQNILGKTVLLFDKEKINPGQYLKTVSVKELPGGTYFAKIIVGDFTQIKKFVIAK